jgi:Recombination endonuclease VII
VSKRREYVNPAMRRHRAVQEQRQSGIPACWTWPLPDPADVAFRLPAASQEGQDDRVLLMAAWQADRCAVCGIPLPSSSVVDHDHYTGLARGFLCRSCNTYEAFGSLVIFDRYRLVNPASVCGVEWLYAEPTAFAPSGDMDAVLAALADAGA